MVQFSAADRDALKLDPTFQGLGTVWGECQKLATTLGTAQGWPDTDFRIKALHRPKNIIQGVLALLSFQKVIFPTKAYWDTFLSQNKSPSQAEMHHFVGELDQMIRFVCLQGWFSVLESEMRIIVRKLDSNACNQGKASFATIYAWLSARNLKLSQNKKLIELLRLTRNTIHNNGVFYPEKGGDVTVEWKGVKYSFVVGMPVPFVGWSFLTSIGKDVVSCMWDLVSDPKVVALPA